MRRWSLVFPFALLAVFAAISMAEEKKTELKSGQAALDFRLNDQDGNIVHLASFSANSEGAAKPKRVLLAFYPKDFTGG